MQPLELRLTRGASAGTGKRIPRDRRGLFIESDRVEGTVVYNPDGHRMGSIKRLIIEKVSGRIAYVVISFGERGDSAHALPWGKLNYDHNLGGYRRHYGNPAPESARVCSPGRPRLVRSQGS